MNFKMIHTNINVRDLSKSLSFYEEAFGLRVIRTKEHPDGKFKLVYISDDKDNYQIELTWLADRADDYTHGDNDLHIAFETDDYAAAYKKHKEMGCTFYENEEMKLYFIQDPDGYWLEVLPAKK